MKKLLLAAMTAICIACLCLSTVTAFAKTDERTKISDWNGGWNNFGVTREFDGVGIRFNGVTTNGYDENYVNVELRTIRLSPMHAIESGYDREVFARFAFVSSNTYDLTDWNCGNVNGIYFQINSFENNGDGGYIKYFVQVHTDAGWINLTESTDYLQAPSYLNGYGVQSISVIKEERGYSFFINGCELLHEEMANLPDGLIADESGKTYFAYQSTGGQEDGSDHAFSVLSINDVKDFGRRAWNGGWNNFGVYDIPQGLYVKYNGVTTSGYDENYVQADVVTSSFPSMQWIDNAWDREVYAQFSFTSTNVSNEDWNCNCEDGIYMMLRSFENNGDGGYLQYFLRKCENGIMSDMSSDWAYLQAPGYLPWNGITRIAIRKETQGYSLLINDYEIEQGMTTTLNDGLIADENGKTYFGYQSMDTSNSNNNPAYTICSVTDEPHVTVREWAGCVNNAGVKSVSDGIIVKYDGHMINGINANNYVRLDVSVLQLLNSTIEDNNWVEQEIVKFAFIKSAVDPDWSNSTDGWYIEIRNVNGKLYMQIYAIAGGNRIDVADSVTDMDFSDFKTIEIIREAFGYSLYINGVEYGADATSGLKDCFFADANGDTYLGVQTYSTYGETDARTLVIKNFVAKGSRDVIYLVDGVEYKRSAYSYGAKILTETVPVKEGYDFSGWSTIPSVMGEEDVIVTGTFSARKHFVIYMVDGVEYKRVEYAYGESIVPEKVPEKDGKEFSGWSTIPSVMGDEDVVVTGTFKNKEQGRVFNCSSFGIGGSVALALAAGVGWVIKKKEK